MASIAENVAAIRAQMTAAAQAAGRDSGGIRLLAATKTQSVAAIREAVSAGIDLCGENRVQELIEKHPLGAYDGVPIHFIGHLQRNKVRQVVGLAELIHSVDSIPLLQEINRCAALKGICQDLLLEVNVGRESSKSGFLPEDLASLYPILRELPHVRVRGLMSIPPVSKSPGDNRPFFAVMHKLFIDTREKIVDNKNDMVYLSMGMTLDFQDAIAEGSNLIRVGTAIFGPRPNAALAQR